MKICPILSLKTAKSTLQKGALRPVIRNEVYAFCLGEECEMWNENAKGRYVPGCVAHALVPIRQVKTQPPPDPPV